jgi:hypothetical protein
MRKKEEKTGEHKPVREENPSSVLELFACVLLCANNRIITGDSRISVDRERMLSYYAFYYMPHTIAHKQLITHDVRTQHSCC